FTSVPPGSSDTVRPHAIVVAKTSIDALAEAGSVLPASTVAVFCTGESATVACVVVGEEMWTVRNAPEAMSPKTQVSTPLAIPHWTAPVPPFINQLRPASGGSASVRVTSLAAPPPERFTVIVYPIAFGATTFSASAVLVTESAGGPHDTVVFTANEAEVGANVSPFREAPLAT